MRDAIKSLFARITWDAIVINMLMLAGMAAVVYYADKRSVDDMTKVIIAAVGIAGVYYVRKSVNIGCHAWHQRRFMKFCGALCLLSFASTIEANNHLSVGSSNQDGLTADRVAAKGRSDAADMTVNIAAQQVLKLRGEAAWKNVDLLPLDAIQKKIDGEKATRFYREVTQGCTITKGPQTTEFCRALAQLEADKAMASRKLVLDVEIPAAEKALEEARAERKRTKYVTSGERADTRNIRKVAAMVGFQEFDVELSNAVLFLIGLVGLLALTEWLHVSATYEGKQLPPWPLFARIGRIGRGIGRGIARGIGLAWYGRGKEAQAAPGAGVTETPIVQAEPVATPLVPHLPAPAAGGVTVVQQRFSDARFAQHAAAVLAQFRRDEQARAA